MIVVPPNITEYTVNLIPRFVPNTTINVTVTSEDSGASGTQPATTSYLNGILTVNITFPFTTYENLRFSFVGKDGEDVVFRGLGIVTLQDPQDYIIDNDNWQHSAQ